MSGTNEEGDENASLGGAAQRVGSAAADIIGQQDSRRAGGQGSQARPLHDESGPRSEAERVRLVVWAREFGLDYGINMVPGGIAFTLTRTWVSDLVWDVDPGDFTSARRSSSESWMRSDQLSAIHSDIEYPGM